jgi:hypothetical protein
MHAAVGIVLSLILIAVGAILAFAVHSTSSGVDVNTVGWILMIVGFILFLVSLAFWRTWLGAGLWGWGGPGYYEEGAPVVRRRAYWPTRRRTTYVEEEPPAGPPY